METVFIVDYGAGNLGSLRNMLMRKCGVNCEILREPEALTQEGKIILPGVGHFGFASKALLDSGWAQKLRKDAQEGRVILGICLGAQLLLERSEEGEGEGLSLIPGEVARFKSSQLRDGERVPHMGWSDVSVMDEQLQNAMATDSRFYFVHSFHLKPNLPEHVLMNSEFANGFCSAIRKDNVTGVQFHPEKSHHFGIAFLKAWLAGS
ncbi:imidazole glycerol phosphate synthase subunit HisH [Flavobacteriales bacterium]|nr:imidazole glycerol phosphate synthase subunit HisH [Flavobacteriales bacterium]